MCDGANASHMCFVFVLIGSRGEEGRRSVDGERRAHAYLPSCRAVAVAFVFEVGHTPHHPVVNLRQRQPLVRRALDGLGDQVGVGEVSPRVSP